MSSRSSITPERIRATTMPPRNPRNLVEFKAWLARPNVRLAVRSHEFEPRPGNYLTVTQVDNLGFTTSDGVRRLFRSSKAWEFKDQYATFILSPETLHRAQPGYVSYLMIHPEA